MVEAAQTRRNRVLLSQWSDLLDQDSFRRFWLMRMASTGAFNALSYAMLVFTVRLSGSALATGGLLLTIVVPAASFGAIAGVAVDRMPRGLILFLSNCGRAALMFGLIAAKEDLAALYVVSLAFNIIGQFAVPAESAVLPYVVRTDRLTAANSFLSLGTLAAQALGIVLIAPVLLKTTNGDPLILILMGLFAFSAVLVTIIPQFHFTHSDTGGGRLTMRQVRRDFSEGWMTLARDGTAYLSLILSVVAATSILVMATLLPKYATHVLGIRPENLVFILAPAVIGIFVGIRTVEYLADRFNGLATISGAYLLMAASLVALGLVPATAKLLTDLNPFGAFDPGPLSDRAARIAATIVYANCYGFALTVVVTMGRTILNHRIPLQMQGRVFAAQNVLSNLIAIVPVVIAGLLADAVGVGPVLVVAGCAALAAAVWSRLKTSRVVPART